VRKRYVPLLIGALALASLVFLYVRAQAVDLRQYASVNETVTTLQRLDAEVGQEVLRLRQGLVNHYDALAARVREIKAGIDHLEDSLGELAQPGGPLYGRFVLLVRTSDKFAQGVNDYATQNALVRNSEAYLPREIRRLGREIRHINPELALRLDRELHDNLMYYLLHGDPAVLRQVREATRTLSQAAGGLPPAQASQLRNVLAHAGLLVERKQIADAAIESLLSTDFRQRLQDVFDLYRQHYLVRQKEAGLYRLGLFVFSAALLGYLVHVSRIETTTRRSGRCGAPWMPYSRATRRCAFSPRPWRPLPTPSSSPTGRGAFNGSIRPSRG